MTNNPLVPASSSIDVQTPQRNQYTRKGRYDKDVEIFRNGQTHEGMLSQVLVHDCFCMVDKPQLWFKCLSPIKTFTANRSIDAHQNPTFIMAGLEVVQAPARIERPTMMLESMTDSKQMKDHTRLLGFDANDDESDVQDVEFKERE
jgi:hypothetical protein